MRTQTHRFRLDSRPIEAPEGRSCDHPGCLRKGAHRAPRSRADVDKHRPDMVYFWFCLDHVRDYNRTWDYFAGMSREEIEAFQAGVATWHRGTWKPETRLNLEDDFDIEDEIGPLFRRGRRRNGGEPRRPPLSQEDEALALLGITERPVTLQKLKQRYKELAKRLHPDLNGGDAVAEERLKQVNQAYAFLLTRGFN